MCLALNTATIVIYAINVCVILATVPHTVPQKRSLFVPLAAAGALTIAALVLQLNSDCHVSYTKLGAAVLALHIFASGRETCHFYSIYMQDKYNNASHGIPSDESQQGGPRATA